MPAPYPSTPPSREFVTTLLAAFLKREIATTRLTYTKALEDYRQFARAKTVGDAIHRLLSLTAPEANALVEKYKSVMTGRRNDRGDVISGRGLSSASVNLRLTALRSLIKKANKRGVIPWQLDVSNLRDEPVRDVRGPSLVVVNKMLMEAKTRPGLKGPRDYAILRLFSELSLRLNEIVGLDLRDFDRDRSEIRIRGKGRRQKKPVSCSEATAQAIQHWVDVRPATAQGFPLFTNLIPGRASRLSASGMYNLVRRSGAKALPLNSPDVISPHRMRHAGITTVIGIADELKLSRGDVQIYSRHKDSRMVDRYYDAHQNAQAVFAEAAGKRLV